MLNYEFKAKDGQGKTKNGIIKAENLNEFYAKMKEQNMFCLSVREIEIGKSMALSVGQARATGGQKLTLKEIAIFCRQFATMMNAGITVVKCLDILYRQAESKRFKHTMLELYESIKKGNALSTAMRDQGKAFPNLLISMIESGEASGKLDDVMLSMSTHYEKEKVLKGKIKTAMIYPIILITVTIGVVILLLTTVMPKIFEVFGDNASLPGSTKVLLGISDFLVNYWYIAIIVLVGIIVGFAFLLQIPSIRLAFDRLKLKIPVVGKLLIIIYTSRFAATVAALYSSGVSIIEAIKIAANVLGNQFVGTKLEEVINEIKQGQTFSKALVNINVFPAMFSSMVYIGEESGALGDILHKTSSFYDEDAQSATSKMIALMEPCMIVIMALIIGFIVISIVQPMFGMYDLIS